MMVLDENDEIWFAYKELLNALEYDDTKSAKKYIDINEIYFKPLSSIRNTFTSKTHNLQPNTKMINIIGLYILLFLSTKPLAKQFTEKYISEIMPLITLKGNYISNSEDQERIDKLNDRIDKLKMS